MCSKDHISHVLGKINVGKHTSNLKNHLAVKHTNSFNEVISLNKCREEKESKRTTQKTDDIIQTLKNLCMKLIVVHGRPFGLINDEPFQKLLHLAASSNRRSKEINEKAIKVMITNVARDFKLKIAAEIRHKLVCLKIDSVTCLKRRFLGIHIQYMKYDQIIVRNLLISEVHESQTDDFFKEKLLEVINEFMISKEQIYSVTTDNSSNINNVTKLIEGNYHTEYFNDNEDHESESVNEENEMSDDFAHSVHGAIQNFLNNDDERDFKIREMLCVAHTLQLAVRDAIAENVQVQATLKLARKMSKIMSTPTNRISLKSANLKVPRIDCSTRWTSTYSMLVRLLALKEFIENLSHVAILIPPEFWSEIGNLVNCLDHLNECTLILQKEQLTIGDFIMTWMKCKSKVGSLSHCFASSLQKAMESTEKTLFDMDIVLECLYLDGRLNIILSEEQCQKARGLLNQTWRQIQRLKETSQVVSSENPQSGSNSDSEQAGSSNTRNYLEDILARKEKLQRVMTGTTFASFNSILYELRHMPRVSLDTNIISHWCNRGVVSNSDLCLVANSILATPATQVSVVTLISSLKFMLNPLRSNLRSNLLQNMLFIRWNKDLLD